MPGQNNPVTAAQLETMTSNVVLKSNDAVASLAAYEQSPPPKDSGDVCADLQTLKEKLQDEIAAINATMADLGCGA